MLCFVWPQISSISVLEKFIENTSIIQWIIFCWSFWDFEGRDRQRGGKKKYWQKYPFSLFSLIEAIFDFDILHARQKMKAVSFSFFLFFTLLLFFLFIASYFYFCCEKIIDKTISAFLLTRACLRWNNSLLWQNGNNSVFVSPFKDPFSFTSFLESHPNQ